MSYTQRPGEIRLDFDPGAREADAGLSFIGHIETPWDKRSDCPKRGTRDGDICRIHVHPEYQPGLASLESCTHIFVLYWMHQARRDLIVQAPAFRETVHGCFALRTPVRPNPVSLSVCRLESVSETVLSVRGLDCLNGTPLVDIKPYFATNDSVPEAQVGWQTGGRAFKDPSNC